MRRRRTCDRSKSNVDRRHRIWCECVTWLVSGSGRLERPLVLGWFRMDFAEPVAGFPSSNPEHPVGASASPISQPSKPRIESDTRSVKKWIIGGVATLLVVVGVVVAYGAIASQGKWRGLDPRIASILSKDARPDVWCRGLQTPSTTPEGLWTTLGRKAGMSSSAVQKSFYDFCGIPIPANDPGLGSDQATQDLSKEIESYREICRPLVARGDYTSEADCLSHDGYLR